MEIQVTQNDIDKGRSWESQSCPIAQALLRMGYTDVSVGTEDCGFQKKNVYYTALLPAEAKAFIREKELGDDDHDPQPFHFEIHALRNAQ